MEKQLRFNHLIKDEKSETAYKPIGTNVHIVIQWAK